MTHKNKTLATLLAIVLGGLGVHRFYLHGRKDMWGWLHFAALPLSLLAWLAAPDQPLLFTGILFVISVLVGQLEALMIGLTPDERWDAACNPRLGKAIPFGLAGSLAADTGDGQRHHRPDRRHRPHLRPAVYRRRLRLRWPDNFQAIAVSNPHALLR